MSDTQTRHRGTAEAHVAAFDALAPALPGGGLPWVESTRRDALARFRQAGVPSRRLEAWKFTNLGRLADAGLAPPSMSEHAPAGGDLHFGPDEYAARLVFSGGRFDEAASDIPDLGDGVTVTTLSRALDERPDLLEGRLSSAADPAGALSDLNAAFMTDGAVVVLEADTQLPKPVVVVFAGGDGDAALHLRNVVALGPGAVAQVIEYFVSAADATQAGFTNAVSDLRLAAGARLTHVRLQDEGPATVHASRAVADIAEGADYASFTLAMGGDVSRQESDVTFAGRDGKARLYGAYLGRGRQHHDHTTRVDHATPHCVTDELFKGVLDDRAHGVFQGLVRVAPHAVGTDARQKNQALLLSDRAVADTKPELEILADDVKCAHGATVGDLDADALFYLMARGVPRDEARRLLIGGFIGEVIDRFDSGTLGGYLHDRMDDWQSRAAEEHND